MNPRHPNASPGVLRKLLTRLRLRRCARVGAGTVVLGRVWVRGPGTVTVGARVVLDGWCAPIELHAGPGGAIRIGDDVRIGAGTSIEAMSSVIVGDGCRIDPYCKILDNDFHHVHGDRFRAPPSRPVTVGEGAVVRRRAVLLPGATVREGAIVPPCTAVRGSSTARAAAVPGQERR